MLLNFGGFNEAMAAVARVCAMAEFFPSLGRGHCERQRCRACRLGNEGTGAHTQPRFAAAMDFLRKQEGISADLVGRHLSQLARRIGRRAPGTLPHELIVVRRRRRTQPATHLVPAASYGKFE